MTTRTIVRVVILIAIVFFTWFNQAADKTVRIPAITPEATTAAQANYLSERTHVKRVIDGDTLEIESGQKVRYIGIDTPELHDPRKPVGCFGEEAKSANSALVEGKDVRLEKDVSETDKFGRLLRYVYVGDVMVNEYLVRQGFAHVATFPPDVAHQSLLLQAQQEAHENLRGLWSACK